MIRVIILCILTNSMLFAQENITKGIFSLEGLSITGGVTYSSVGGNDTDDYDDLEYIPGISFGLEKTLPNGLIGGISYTQRGFGSYLKNSSMDFISESEDENRLNYLTININKALKIDWLNLFIGGEIGYFWNGEFKSEWSISGFTSDGYETVHDSDTESIDHDEWKDDEGTVFDYGVVAGVKYEYNTQITLIGLYYFGLPQLVKDVELMNRSFQIKISFGLD